MPYLGILRVLIYFEDIGVIIETGKHLERKAVYW